MSENRDSCDMVRLPDNTKLYTEGFKAKPGDFAWQTNSDDGVRWLRFITPGEHYGRIPVHRSGEPPPAVHVPYWAWDGNEDRPTLSPSVHCIGAWHGFFTAGRMVSC